MNPVMAGILKLYENALAQRGIVRMEAVLGDSTGETTRERKLGHARWMIDQMLHPDGMPILSDERLCLAWLGFVQGVLWAEGMFTLSALRDHARQLVAVPSTTVKERSDKATVSPKSKK